MIDRDFLDGIAELATNAAGLEVVQPDGEAPGVYYLRHPSGQVEAKQAAPPRQDRQFIDLDSLAKWGWLGESPVAWVNLGGVIVTLGDPRYSSGRLPLQVSPQYNTLCNFQNTNWLDQKAVIKILRSTFYQCVPDSMLATFRRLKHVKNEKGESDIQLNKANIGRTLENEVTGAGAIPDTLQFTIPMVTDPFMAISKKPISCMVDVSLEEFKFAFIPLPLELDRAKRSAEIELFNLVSDSVVRNRPGAPDDGEADQVRDECFKCFPVYLGYPTAK